MDAGKRNIADIFNKGRLLQIPFFQRGYVWEKENWERFHNDMLDTAHSQKNYFLGSVILKSKEMPANAQIGDCRSVIDGQQRLTTIALYFKALTEAKQKDNIYESTFYNWAHEFILQHNHMDNEIFQAIVTDNLTKDLETKYASNNVLKCYRYFQELAPDFQGIDPLILLGHIYFVGIDLNHDEDEQQIFDTINSLGVRLTVAELLKNHLFSAQKDMDLYKKTWLETFEKDEETRKFWDAEITSGRTKRSNIDVLLQAFFTIKNDGTDFKLSELFQEYKTYIHAHEILSSSSAKSNFVGELIEYAKLYKDNIDPEKLDNNMDADNFTDRMNVLFFKLETSTAIPYVLYILKNVLDLQEKNKIFKVLESYFVRRIICGSSTKNYNRLIKSLIASNVITATSLAEFLKDKEEKEDKYPTSEQMAIEFPKQKLTNVIATGILYLLEMSVRHEAKQQTLLKGINCYELEHIMPQKWEDNWSISETDPIKLKEMRENRNAIIKTLGNMTILTKGLNRSMHNANWNTKKKGTEKWEGLKKFGEGIETFSPYISLDGWNESAISQRSSDLLNYALKVWPDFENE